MQSFEEFVLLELELNFCSQLSSMQSRLLREELPLKYRRSLRNQLEQLVD